jgi:hypothetical protein
MQVLAFLSLTGGLVIIELNGESYLEVSRDYLLLFSMMLL